MADERFESLVKEGFNLHQRQQYRRAVPLLEQALALRPADYFVNLVLGIDYLRLGESRKSVTRLEVAERTRQNDPIALGYLGEVYASLQQFDRAAEAAQRSALGSDSSDQSQLGLVKFYLHRFRTLSAELRSTTTGLAYSHRLRAHVLRERRDPDEYEALVHARALEPQLPGLETAFGGFHLLTGQWEQAADHFARARIQNPNDLEMMIGEAVLAAHSGDLLRAKRLLLEVGSRSKTISATALREWPSSVPIPQDLGPTIAKKIGPPQRLSLSEAFRQQRWESLINESPSRSRSAQHSWWLGVARTKLKQFTAAIVPLERARVDPGVSTEASYCLALCYAKAVEKIKDQLSGKEANPVIHLLNGEVMLRLTLDGPSAVAEFLQAVKAFPQDPAAWTSLAEAQMMTGDTQGARQSAQRGLMLDSTRMDASQIVGEACLQERDYEAAIPPLRLALQAQPANLRTRLLLGTAYSRTQRDEEACTLLESVLKEGYPDEKGSTHYLLGSVLRRLGRAQDSEQAFQRAKALADAFSSSAHGLAPHLQRAAEPEPQK